MPWPLHRRRACGRVRVVTRPAMHARDESALRASGVRGHKLGRFDLDAMNRAGRSVAASAGIGAAAVRAGRAVARVIFIARIAARNFRSVLERLERRFGFARRFERVAHNRIHVITTADVRHVCLLT